MVVRTDWNAHDRYVKLRSAMIVEQKAIRVVDAPDC